MSAHAVTTVGTLNARLGKRTGFWRSLAEMTLLAGLIGLASYPVGWSLGSPWVEIFSLSTYLVIIYAAWRLAPGSGSLLRRGVRVIGWTLLWSLVNGLIGYGIFKLLPYEGRVYGLRPEAFQISLVEYLLNLGLIALGVLLPTRALVTLWLAGRNRLRWLLTFSYLLLGVLLVTIVPITWGIFIGISSFSSVPVLTPPDVIAARVAEALAPELRRGTSPDALSPVLQSLLDGSGELPVPPGRTSNEEIEQFFDFSGVQRLTLLRADGVVLASAGADAPVAGEALPEDRQADLALLLAQVRGGGCASGRPADGPAIDSSLCAITGEDGALIGAMLVENQVDGRIQWGLALGRILGITLVGTSITLVLALPVVTVLLLLAFGIGLLIARRLTRRLELLAQAAGDVAAGDLARRVEIDRADEIGRLGADFNAMAARLAERERALADEAARAEALLESNRRLVANVSHELRTPLTTLRGYVESLEQDHGDKLPRHDLAVIQGEVQRLTRLIEDLFTLARAEAQQLPLVIEPVDAGALVHRLVDTLAPLARRDRQIELVATLPEGLPLVQADRGRLEQVLLNLAHNALRHTPPGGIIAFEGAASDDKVTLSVADTGVGITPEELPLVFERFYRGDQSRARETGGAGLGLALVRELVGAMGGRIEAESTPGRGSRFSVELRSATTSTAFLQREERQATST